MTESLLDHISRAHNDTMITDKWTNGALGEIVDIKGDGNYRFVDYTTYDDGKLKQVHLSEDDEMTCPIVATGFVGYWLHNRDKGVRTVFEEYFARKLSQYEHEHEYDDDAWERDLKKEFVTRKHLSVERKLMKESEAIYAYLTEADVKRITGLTTNYLKFARKKRKELYPPQYTKGREKQEEFIAPYRMGGAAWECMRWIRTEYNLPVSMFHRGDGKTEKEQLTGQWKVLHEETMPLWIKDEYAEFDPDVIFYCHGNLSEELNENLKQCHSHEDRIRYIISLLQPFKEFAEAFYPRAMMDERKRAIKNLKEDLKYWQGVPEDALDSTGKPMEPKKQIEACERFLEDYKKDIEYWKYVQHSFYELVQRGLSRQYTEGEDPEMVNCISGWWRAMIGFANHLATVALTYGINLNDVQEQCEVFLKTYSLVDLVDDKFITSYDHARRLLKEIEDKKPKAVEPEKEEHPTKPKAEEPVKTDFDHLKEYEDNPDLDHYLSEDHWNWHVNSILYKNLLVFHGGQELGAFLNPSMGENYKSPVNDYTSLYGHLFNEAYRICNDVLRSGVPETKVAHFAHEAAVWKFRNMTDEEGKPLKLIPNVIDLIESYHILGMVNAILYLANCDERKVDDFLLALSVYKDEGLYFCLHTHQFGPYNEIYQAFICATIKDGTNLRPDYDLKGKHDHLYAKFPWYKDFSDELDKRIAEGEAQKQKQQQEASKPKDKPKKNQQKKGDKSSDKPVVHYTLNYVNPGQARDIRLGFVQQKLEEWKWMDATYSITPYELLFGGTDVDCKLNWIGNAPTLYLLISELLKQPFIKKYKGCSASSIVTTQFSCGLNQHTERVSPDEQLKIKRIIFLLNPKSDIPMKGRRNSEVPDISDEALAMVLSGELSSSSHP